MGPDALLAPEVTVVLETDPAVAREIGRAMVSRYTRLTNYVSNWRRLGFSDDDVREPGSDRLIDALVAHGDEAAIVARIREHLDAGADHVCIQLLPSGGDQIEGYHRIAAEFGLKIALPSQRRKCGPDSGQSAVKRSWRVRRERTARASDRAPTRLPWAAS